MLKAREKKLLALYEFAVKYARSFRNSYIEVDDLAHEMMLAVLEARWKSEAYATRIMRNRFYDLIRRGKRQRGYFVPLDEALEAQNSYTLESYRWDAGITVHQLLTQIPVKQAKVLKQIMRGEPVKMSRMTVYRYLRKARELLAI